MCSEEREPQKKSVDGTVQRAFVLCGRQNGIRAAELYLPGVSVVRDIRAALNHLEKDGVGQRYSVAIVNWQHLPDDPRVKDLIGLMREKGLRVIGCTGCFDYQYQLFKWGCHESCRPDQVAEVLDRIPYDPPQKAHSLCISK